MSDDEHRAGVALSVAEVRQLRPDFAEWTEARIKLVKDAVCPKGISDEEFSLFIEQCKRSGLDPLLKEAFCVPRKANLGTRESPRWAYKHEFQPSETGMLARAERFPDYRGVQASAVFSGDAIEIDAGEGTVTHKFNPVKRSGSIAGAWARVVRASKAPIVVWLDFSGYAQQTPLWGKIPTTMIEKCARVAALRKAYPEAFGGLYIREELPPEEEAQSPIHVPSHTQSLKASRTEEVKAKLKATRPQAEEAEVVPEAAPAVGFGPHKGRPIAELDDDELSGAIDLAHEKLAAEPEARWARPMRENLSLLEAEAGSRMKPVAPAAPEAPPPPLAAFGGPEFKGRPLSSLSLEQLQKLIEMGSAMVAKTPKAEWAPEVKRNLDAMRIEAMAKEAAATSRQPGEDE
jgi:phage recombination protein Bet